MSDDPETNSNGSKPARTVIAQFQDKVTDISWGIFSIGLLGGLLSVGYEIFAWLKNGEWPRLPFYSVFAWLNIDLFPSVNSIEWQGIKKILLWCLELPLSIGLMGLGAVSGGTFYVIFSRKD